MGGRERGISFSEGFGGLGILLVLLENIGIGLAIQLVLGFSEVVIRWAEAFGNSRALVRYWGARGETDNSKCSNNNGF